WETWQKITSECDSTLSFQQNPGALINLTSFRVRRQEKVYKIKARARTAEHPNLAASVKMSRWSRSLRGAISDFSIRFLWLSTKGSASVLSYFDYTVFRVPTSVGLLSSEQEPN